jgi:predicted alpha/beta hydrolase family esterase
MFDIPILNVPGIWNSGPEHWQTLWELAESSIRRVEQRDWDKPDRAEWTATLERAARAAGGLDSEIAVVAHSLGCLLVAHWAMVTRCKVRGALIVAPVDPFAPAYPKDAADFAELPLGRWPFPSILVASTNDSYGDSGFARACASAWGSEFVDAGPLGHINADSGLAGWPAGLALLRRVVEDPNLETREP